MQSYPTRSFVSADSIVEEAPEVGGVFLPKIQEKQSATMLAAFGTKLFWGVSKSRISDFGSSELLVWTLRYFAFFHYLVEE